MHAVKQSVWNGDVILGANPECEVCGRSRLKDEDGNICICENCDRIKTNLSCLKRELMEQAVDRAYEFNRSKIWY